MQEGSRTNVCDEAPQSMNQFDGAYGPYFPNFTATMLFIWVTKHMICVF